MPTIQANGIQLYFEQHGWDNPGDVLVLSNGILMSTASWAYQTPVLSRHCRLLLYDCRGMWQSEHPPGPYTMEQHADDLAALLQVWASKRLTSAASPTAPRLAWYSHCATLSEPGLDPLVGGQPGGPATARHDGRVDLGSADPGCGYAFRGDIAGQFFRALDRRQPGRAASWRQRYRNLDMDAFLELLLSFSQLGITADLHRIGAPALVMVGEEDILKPRKYAEIIAAQIPNSEFVVIPHAGHAVYGSKHQSSVADLGLRRKAELTDHRSPILGVH